MIFSAWNTLPCRNCHGFVPHFLHTLLDGPPNIFRIYNNTKFSAKICIWVLSMISLKNSLQFYVFRLFIYI